MPGRADGIMNLTIKQAVLHVLDSGAGEPVLSDRCLDLSADGIAFLSEHVEKAFAGDERKACSFTEGSPFLQYPLHDLEQFLPTSREIALRLFQFMRIYPSIPPADVLMMQAEIEGAPYFLLLKLNYRAAYIHGLESSGEGKSISLLKQHTALPAPGGKAGEAFVLNLATGELQVTEKKYDVDGKKDVYFSSRFLECTAALTEKQKFKEIKKAAETVAGQYGEGGRKAETRVAAVLCEQMAEAREASVEALCDELYPDSPAAKEEFAQILREKKVDMSDTVQVAPATVRRMEKQSLRTQDGVEIKIPIALYESDEAVEFIGNPDGTVSLLIKNVVL